MQKISSLPAFFYALAISGVLLLLIPASVSAQSQELPERPDTQQLLPETTVALFKLRDLSEFVEKMKNSSTGQMVQSEAVAPLFNSFYDNAEKQYDNVSEDVGLSLEEIQSLPSGEITFAMIAPRRKDLVYVVMMEIDEENEAVAKALERVGEVMNEAYDKVAERGGEMPEKEDALGSSENDFNVKIDKIMVSGRPAYICKHKGWFIGCTSEEELENMFIRWSGEEVDKVRSLSENRKFVTIAKRCSVSDDILPDARFFLDPIGLFKAATRGNVGANFAVALLPTLGLDGVLAVGGNMYVDHDKYESISHGHLLLASPREGLLNALAMKPDSYEPEPWVPVEIANYMATSWDVPQMLSSIKEISDTIMEGKYDEFFEGIQDEIQERNADVDLQEDLIDHLSGRFSFVRPILSGTQLNGIGNVASFGLADVESVEESLEKIFGSEDMTKWWAEREYGSIRYWSTSEEAVEFREKQVKDRVERRRKKLEARGDELPDFGPRPEVRSGTTTFGIIGEQLVLSDSEEFFEFAVDTFNGDKPALADDEDFLKNMDTMTKLLKSDLPAAVFFSDARRELGFYLKAFDNENMMNVLDAQVEKREGGFLSGVKDSIEEHGFPAVEDIEEFLTTSGGFITTDDSGYHFLLFQEKPTQE